MYLSKFHLANISQLRTGFSQLNKIFIFIIWSWQNVVIILYLVVFWLLFWIGLLHSFEMVGYCKYWWLMSNELSFFMMSLLKYGVRYGDSLTRHSQRYRQKIKHFRPFLHKNYSTYCLYLCIYVYLCLTEWLRGRTSDSR